ncbi:hypothetical protein SAMN05216276_109525 [Streptosporangium subroseum]|uniref:Uncharacterized protein n=1 Tax=Streptosporangium subroseum TaxID=106412 RepID=A0A239P7J9_9ACTN|nr:hypothetical protein SAMN05216276_109525 [Streptosporangium subroseum]
MSEAHYAGAVIGHNFGEFSALSTDLTAHPHAGTELHRYAEALLTNLAAGATSSGMPTKPIDVPGYWLAPAVEALTLLLDGEEALEPLARAAQRDEQRTALFLCLALAVAGQGDQIHASWLGIAFGELSLDRPVTHGQRALWLAAARGAYGPAGKIFVLRKLDAVASATASEPDRWLRALTPDDPSTVVPPSLSDFPGLAELPELAEPVQAAAQLTRLRDRCVEITSVRENTGGNREGARGNPTGPPGERTTAQNEGNPGNPAGPAAQNEGNPTGSPDGPAAWSGGNPPGPLDDPAAWSDGEPLTVLRHLIGSNEAEGPMSSLGGHLLSDLQPGSHRYQAAIALHVAAPIVRTAAESLVQATQVTPPESVVMPILGHRVTLRPEGPDAESLAAAEERISIDGTPVRGRPWLAYALLALGAVALVIALAIPVALPLAALGLILAAVGGHRLWRRRKREQADAEYVVAQLSELREMAQGAVWALHEYAREAEARAQTATSDLAELTRLLRRGPRAG